MAAVNELITKFSFVGSLKPQDSFNKNLKVSIGLVAGASTAIYGATAAFIAWTTSVTESIDPIVQLSRETGVAIGTIQELGYAASQNGSDLDAVKRSITELTKRAGEFSRTGGGTAAEAFLQLGVSVRGANGEMKTADKIMMDVRRNLKGFNRGEQADILDKLGIDKSMIQLLNQSSSAVDSLREKARALGTITKEQADAAASLNDSNTTLKFGLQGLQNQIATGFAPVIQTLTEDFITFLMVNKDVIKDGITALGRGLLAATGFIRRMIPVAIVATGAFIAWKVAAVGLGAVLGTIFSPVILITAAIVGIALAVDDLIVAFNGGNSVIADFIKQWTGFDIVPALRDWVAGIKKFAVFAYDKFIEIRDLVFGMFSGIGDIWNGDFAEGFSKIYDSAVGIVGMIKDLFFDAFRFIGEKLGDLVPGFISDLIAEDDAVGFNGGNNGAVNNGVTNNSNQTANIKQNSNIHVYASDAEAAGKAVYGYQNRQHKETKQYYNRGGM